MKKCECGQSVASNARVCPRCGNRFTHPLVRASAWLILLSLGLLIIGRTVSSIQNEPAFVIQHCGEPDRDFVEKSPGSTVAGRHLVYGKYDTDLFFLGSGVTPHWRLFIVSSSNGVRILTGEEANRRMPCAKGQLYSRLK
jgi:hypothetical protein